MTSRIWNAMLAASFLVAAPAVAAQPDGGHYVWVPAGTTVILVPATPAAAVDFPVARMIAQQQAIMHRMFADIDSLMAMPDPGQMIRSVMNGGPQVTPGSGGIVVTSITTGSGTCSRTVTYGYPANGGQPQVKVSSFGNACGALRSSGPVGVAQPVRPPQITPMQPAPRNERLWAVGYPPKPVTSAAPPRL